MLILQGVIVLLYILQDIGSFSSHDITQIKRLLGDYEKLHSCMKLKIAELEHEKVCSILLPYQHQSKDKSTTLKSFLNLLKLLTNFSSHCNADGKFGFR